VIIKGRLDFPRVAMSEPDPSHEPHPCKLRYPILVLSTLTSFHLLDLQGMPVLMQDSR